MILGNKVIMKSNDINNNKLIIKLLLLLLK